jgi:hypothetical protein
MGTKREEKRENLEMPEIGGGGGRGRLALTYFISLGTFTNSRRTCSETWSGIPRESLTAKVCEIIK